MRVLAPSGSHCHLCLIPTPIHINSLFSLSSPPFVFPHGKMNRFAPSELTLFQSRTAPDFHGVALLDGLYMRFNGKCFCLELAFPVPETHSRANCGSAFEPTWRTGRFLLEWSQSESFLRAGKACICFIVCLGSLLAALSFSTNTPEHGNLDEGCALASVSDDGESYFQVHHNDGPSQRRRPDPASSSPFLQRLLTGRPLLQKLGDRQVDLLSSCSYKTKRNCSSSGPVAQYAHDGEPDAQAWVDFLQRKSLLFRVI